MAAKKLTPAEEWKAIQDEDAYVHQRWDALDRRRLRFVKSSGMGRKCRVVVPISDTRGVQITNKFREKGVMKVFAPAFAKKYDFKEVALDD